MARPQKFDYQGALDEGYSDDEIMGFLTQQHPDFDLEGAQKEGYSPSEINEFLSTYKKPRSYAERGKRIAQQFGVSALEGALLPYEVGVMPLALPGGQETLGDTFTRDILNEVYATEGESKGEETELNPFLSPDVLHKGGKYVGARELKEPINLGVRSLIEKATGADLQPEGIIEHGVSFMNWVKDPKKWKDLATLGLKPKEAMKALLPTPMEATRGVGVGIGLEAAEQGQFGPLGTMAAMVVSDIASHGPKAIFHAATHPKETAARAINLFTGGNSKKAWANEIINQARESGIQLDAGTITGSPFIQWLQARAVQSGLSGKALEEFRKDLTGQILREYNSIADEVGTLAFENSYQASEALKDSLKVQESNLQRFFPEETARTAQERLRKEKTAPGRSLEGRIDIQETHPENDLFLNTISQTETPNSYVGGETLQTIANDIKNPIKEELGQRRQAFNERVGMIPAGPQRELAHDMQAFVEENRGSLLLGESTPEHRVVRAAENLLNALRDEHGLLTDVALRDLLLTKTTLQDVANYEFGGSNFQSKYKKLVEDIDNAIQRTLRRTNETILEEFQAFNADYSHFKDTFENKNVIQLFEPKNNNFNAIYDSYVSNPDKLRALEDMLYNHPRGQEILNQIKRDYANRVISNPNLTARDVRNLGQVLGPEFEGALDGFWQTRQFLNEHPLPIARRGQPLGLELPQARTPTQAKPIKAKEADLHKRQKLFEYLSGKSSDQIMKMFDTVEGIKKVKSVLNLTEEGKQLFKDLSRFKLSELIDKNLKNNMTQQVKLGTFSNLLKSTKNKAIVKELLGPESFQRLERLQKNAGKLAESANKFFNASQSGTTLTDVSTVTTAILGVFTGNPYLALPAIANIGGMRVVANLFADKEFLKILEDIILKPKSLKTPISMEESLRRMQPYVQQALIEAKDYNEKQRG